MRAVLLALFAIFAPSVVSGQTLPPEALQNFGKALDQGACRPLPVGNFRWRYNRQTNEPDDQNAELAISYTRLGILETRLTAPDPGSGFGSTGVGVFQVSLRVPFDGNIIQKQAKGVCFNPLDQSQRTMKVVRSETVKGGRTGWTGVIVYVNISGTRCKPIPADWKIPPRCEFSVGSYRVLYKQDPFQNAWLLVGYDAYHEAKFITDSVPKALLQD